MPRASRSNSPGGLGLDIVEIDRISKLARSNPRFLTRVFSKDEIAYCKGKRRKWQHFAVRFAAKEAVWKALGLPGLAVYPLQVALDTVCGRSASMRVVARRD